MADLVDQERITWLKWVIGSMSSIIMLLLGVGVADVRNRLNKVDELLSSNKIICKGLEQVEQRLERIEHECRERYKENVDKWSRRNEKN